ncbi:MAG: aminoglycoside phosphotransferase family protein [Gammaproteobacteria bacterium]|nr:aminoglycoside phosphotransferase family protein [Gammaproteobacteria bacterium]
MNSTELVQFLLARQVITNWDLVNTSLRLLKDVRDRFVLSSVTIGEQPLYMIKQARNLDALGGLQQEIGAYRIICNNTELDSIVPALIAEDSKHGIMVMKLLANAAPLISHLSQENAADRLGVEIGRLHANTQQSINEIGSLDTPWIFSCLSRYPKWRPPELDTILEHTNHTDILADGLMQGFHAWHPSALIHGDLKWEHCLLSSNQNYSQLNLIDWELASFGDPAWDVASIISDIMFSTQYGHEDATISAHKIAQVGGAEKFLQSYSQEQPINSEILRRVALFSGARLFQTCLESASAYGVGKESGVDTLLAMAVDVFRDPNRFSAELSRRFML